MMTEAKSIRCEVECAVQAPRRVVRPWALVLKAYGVLRRTWRVRQERHELAELSEAQLRDMGISTEAQRRELRRPFWDI
jgi:uncharacterized protein YjiS (DUF1127 family)